MTGAQAAAAVAQAGGADVTIERVSGFLSDHYDPRSKTLRLSPEVYDGRSVSSIAVAAHEAGHAIQDVKQYAFLNFRSFTNFFFHRRIFNHGKMPGLEVCAAGGSTRC